MDIENFLYYIGSCIPEDIPIITPCLIGLLGIIVVIIGSIIFLTMVILIIPWPIVFGAINNYFNLGLEFNSLILLVLWVFYVATLFGKFLKFYF